jgi:hypothetical protein
MYIAGGLKNFRRARSVFTRPVLSNMRSRPLPHADLFKKHPAVGDRRTHYVTKNLSGMDGWLKKAAQKAASSVKKVVKRANVVVQSVALPHGLQSVAARQTAIGRLQSNANLKIALSPSLAIHTLFAKKAIEKLVPAQPPEAAPTEDYSTPIDQPVTAISPNPYPLGVSPQYQAAVQPAASPSANPYPLGVSPQYQPVVYQPEPQYQPQYQPEPQYQPQYQPEPQYQPQYQPEPQYQPQYEPEPEPESEPDMSPVQLVDASPVEDDGSLNGYSYGFGAVPTIAAADTSADKWTAIASGLVGAWQQKKLVDINIERMKAGQPPLDVGATGLGVQATVNVDPQIKRMLMVGGIAALALGAVVVFRRRGR